MKRLLMMIGAAVAVGAMLPLSAMADAVRVYDVDDYVQEGLVAHFDGIRNAGATAAHSSTTRTWKNLINENDAAFSSDEYGSWTEDGLGFQFEGVGKNCYAQLQSGLTFGSEVTVQIAVDVDTTQQSKGNYVYPGYFHGGTGYDFGIYSNNKSTISGTIILKSDNDNSRPTIAAWSGKYATAEIFDGKAYLTDATNSLGTGCATSHDIVKDQSVRYCWGGSSENSKRALYGIYYNVRIYERALSLDELAKNRLVDESRFRNDATKGLIPNVIVVNADGTSANEKYFVTGSETFTAPETIEESYGSFRRYGHVVETWDGSSWIGATTNLAGSCTVTPGSSQMRVTWLYLRRVYDVDDYVQDGLVAHFDAIRNAGATVAHDNSATTWANLVDAANYADFTLRDGSASAGWTDTAYQFTNNCMASTISAIDLGTKFTVQIAVTGDGSEQTSGYHAWFNDNPKNDYGFWTSDDGDTITGNFKKLANGNATIRPKIENWGGEYVTWMLDGANSLCYTFETDTIPDGMNLTVVSTYPAARKYCWGGELNGGTTLQALLTADYHNVRMYNRPLTEDEIKHNRVVDEARYRNDATKGLLPNVIVVGADGTSANEKYVADGSLTFTAPETVVNRKGAFRRYGNVVETWDGAAWGGAVTNLSGSCEITVASGDAAKRITWLWTDILRSYDVDDYVQDGLVAHFDGIRNAGASAAHATSGTKWTNLGSYGSAYDAALESWDRSNPVNGEWTATGYDFNTTDTNTFAAIGKAINLGTNFTIQLATTFDSDEQATGNDPYRYPSYFNTYDGSNANGMWTDNQKGLSKLLYGSFDNYLEANFSGGSSKRLVISNWEGQYVTMMLEQTGQAMFFQDDELPVGSACSITKVPGAKRYTWSGAPKNKNKTPVRGVYHSVRMYTNTLDNAQLQLNRKIDEARFRGNCDVTIVNGAIGETGTNGACSFPDGCYNLGDGESWTLTAKSVVVDGCRYQPRLVVEEKVDGEWTQVASIWTESYTLNQASLTNPVRLTWTWEKRIGLTVSFY